MRLYGEIIIDRRGAQTMLYLTCTMISSVDLANYGGSFAKDWTSVDCGIISDNLVSRACRAHDLKSLDWP